MTLGERICAQRTALGMSQDRLAEQLEVSRQSVSKWETDASVPDLDKLVKLSELFHMTLDELVKGETAAAPEKEAAQPERPAEPVPGRNSGRTVRLILGGALITCGLVMFVLVMLLNGSSLELLISGCLALVGLILLLPPVGRLIALWVLWGLIVLVFMPRATGIRPAWVFSATLYQLCGEGRPGPYRWYLIAAWAEVLTGLALAAATVLTLRRRKK